MLSETIKQRLSSALDTTISAAHALAGGDVSAVYQIKTDRGFFAVKHTLARDVAMLEAEADGLRWLRDTQTVQVPEVIRLITPDEDHVDEGALVLEWIETNSAQRSSTTFEQKLGRSLAELHQTSAKAFGLERDNFIGPLPQSNRPCNSWAQFYVRERLEPQIRLAQDAHRLDAKTKTELSLIMDDIEYYIGPAEPPAHLHGDLWSGNALSDAKGAAWLIDPAVYCGHREMDLAMMRLFGGFGSACFRAYEEVFPLSEGAEQRVALYQLYPLLVHVNLFGTSYLAQIKQALSALIT